MASVYFSTKLIYDIDDDLENVYRKPTIDSGSDIQINFIDHFHQLKRQRQNKTITIYIYKSSYSLLFLKMEFVVSKPEFKSWILNACIRDQPEKLTSQNNYLHAKTASKSLQMYSVDICRRCHINDPQGAITKQWTCSKFEEANRSIRRNGNRRHMIPREVKIKT